MSALSYNGKGMQEAALRLEALRPTRAAVQCPPHQVKGVRYKYTSESPELDANGGMLVTSAATAFDARDGGSAGVEARDYTQPFCVHVHAQAG